MTRYLSCGIHGFSGKAASPSHTASRNASRFCVGFTKAKANRASPGLDFMASNRANSPSGIVLIPVAGLFIHLRKRNPPAKCMDQTSTYFLSGDCACSVRDTCTSKVKFHCSHCDQPLQCEAHDAGDKGTGHLSLTIDEKRSHGWPGSLISQVVFPFRAAGNTGPRLHNALEMIESQAGLCFNARK